MVMEQLTIKINGMHDDFAVYAVEGSIKELEGVEDVELDAGIQLAKIKIDTDKVSKEDIERAAEEAGFSVSFQ